MDLGESQTDVSKQVNWQIRNPQTLRTDPIPMPEMLTASLMPATVVGQWPGQTKGSLPRCANSLVGGGGWTKGHRIQNCKVRTA